MTQTVTPRPPVKWIVPLPENDPYGKKSFTNACRGNSDLGEVLNYFLYAASKEVEQDKSLDISTGSITVDRMLETISKHLKVSKKTAIARIQKLAGWEFITPHGYHHRYDVHFKKIEAAIINPPEVEKPKLRGRHAVKSTILTIPTILDDKEHEDCKNLPDLPDGRIVVLEAQIVNLQSQIVDLTAWIVNLQSQIVKLQSLQSSESAPQEAREAQIDPLIITKHYSNITKENIYVNADALTRTQSSENENETHYQQDIPSVDNSQQPSADVPIATTDPQTELIDVATRNTESLVDVTQAAAAAKPARNTSKRGSKRKAERDDMMQKRIDDVFDAMDAFKQKVTGDPEATYQRDMTAADEIERMLAVKPAPTRKRLLRVCYDMWNEKNPKTGVCFWRKHMKPKNIAKEYETRIMALEGDDGLVQDPENEHTNKETKAPSAAVAAGYTDYTNTPPTNYKPLPRKRA